MSTSDTPESPLAPAPEPAPSTALTSPMSIEHILASDPSLLDNTHIDLAIAHFRERRQNWARAEAEAAAQGKKRVTVKKPPAAASAAGQLPSLSALLGPKAGA